LVQRGSLTLWVSEDVIDTWCYQGLRSEVRSLTRSHLKNTWQ
jgi:hypothetical protein